MEYVNKARSIARMQMHFESSFRAQVLEPNADSRLP